SGLQFDEVLVAVDAGEVPREASGHFCVDEDPDYRRYCNEDFGAVQPVAVTTSNSLEHRFSTHFRITWATRLLIKANMLTAADAWHDVDPKLARLVQDDNPTLWPVFGHKLDPLMQPLGLDGGIARAQKNMQRLADLLRARGIALSISVHPWPDSLYHDDE